MHRDIVRRHTCKHSRFDVAALTYKLGARVIATPVQTTCHAAWLMVRYCIEELTCSGGTIDTQLRLLEVSGAGVFCGSIVMLLFITNLL